MSASGTVIQQPPGPLLTRLVTVADEIAAAHIPYCYGGGHVTPARPTHGTYCHNAANQFISGTAYDGLDCSSSVSMLLQASGVNTPTLDSTGFMSFGEAGPGQQFTIWANPEPRLCEHRRTRLGHQRRQPLRRARMGATNHRRLHPTTPAGPMRKRDSPNTPRRRRSPHRMRTTRPLLTTAADAPAPAAGKPRSTSRRDTNPPGARQA